MPRDSAVPRVLVISPHLSPPSGGIERLAEDILHSLPAGQLHCIGVSAESRREPHLEAVAGRGQRLEMLNAAHLTLRAWAVARRFKPDVVHALTWRAGLTALAALPRTPLVVHCMAAELRRPADRVSQFLRRLVLRRARIVVAISRYTAHIALEVSGRQPRVIPPAIGSIPDAEPREPNGCVQILSVSRLVPHKGHAALIEVLGALRREGLDVRLTIVGTGPNMSALQQLVTRLDLQDAIVFTGSVTDGELARLYRSADVFALLSEAVGHEIEGFGIVFLEAASYGIPVVAGRSGGSEDAVDTGKNGFLVAGAAEALSALRSLIRDPELRLRMGRAGPVFAAGFTRDRLGERLQVVYDEATGS